MLSGTRGQRSALKDEEVYTTGALLRRTLTVRYPAFEGRIVLRSEIDWDRDVEATAVSDDRTAWTFSLEAKKKPFLYFKPCQRVGNETQWAAGANALVLMTVQAAIAAHARTRRVVILPARW